MVALLFLFFLAIGPALGQQNLQALRNLTQDQLRALGPQQEEPQTTPRRPENEAAAATISTLRETRTQLQNELSDASDEAVTASPSFLSSRMPGPFGDVWTAAPVTKELADTISRRDIGILSTTQTTPSNNFLPTDERIDLHLGALVDLTVGQARGQITLPLWRGRIRGNGQRVLFVVTDASNSEFADHFGIIHAPSLNEVNDEAVDTDSKFDGTVWEFGNDPGLVARGISESEGAQANPEFSPLKKIRWRNRTVIANVSFVKWGEKPGQSLVFDLGGCSANIRRSEPGKPYIGGGPAGCQDVPLLRPKRRFQGGQLLELGDQKCSDDNVSRTCGFVVMKLHRMVHKNDKYPYVIATATSDKARSEQLGLPHVPRLKRVGRLFESNAVALLGNFRNGIAKDDGGLDRFQFNIVSYAKSGGSSRIYSPIVQLRDSTFDCDRNRKITEADIVDTEGRCPGVAKRISGNKNGTINFNMFQSSRLNLSRVTTPVFLNLPSPVSIER